MTLSYGQFMNTLGGRSICDCLMPTGLYLFHWKNPVKQPQWPAGVFNNSYFMTSTHGRGFKKRGGCWVAKPQTWKKWKFQNSQYVIVWWFWENQFGREFPWFGREFPWFGRELSWSGFGKPLKRIFVEPKKTWFFVRWIPEKNQNRDFVVFLWSLKTLNKRNPGAFLTLLGYQIVHWNG